MSEVKQKYRERCESKNGGQRCIYHYSHLGPHGNEGRNRQWFDLAPTPAEPVIEVAPAEIEWEGPPESETQRERSEYAASQRYPQVPAVPAQEAPREPNFYNEDGEWEHRPAEPQAGAQVPSQVVRNRSTAKGREFWDHVEAVMDRKAIQGQLADEFAATGRESYSEWLFDKNADLKAHLNSITAYATESAKTPITRESILAAPQVAETPIPEDLKEEHGCIVGALILATDPIDRDYLNRFIAYIDRIASLEAEVKARKLHELAQFDEMQGLRRLILSESGK